MLFQNIISKPEPGSLIRVLAHQALPRRSFNMISYCDYGEDENTTKDIFLAYIKKENFPKEWSTNIFHVDFDGTLVADPVT